MKCAHRIIYLIARQYVTTYLSAVKNKMINILSQYLDDATLLTKNDYLALLYYDNEDNYLMAQMLLSNDQILLRQTIKESQKNRLNELKAYWSGKLNYIKQIY